MTELLATENLSTCFGNFYANREISVAIPKGSLFAILGENGSGKSTFLKTIFGLAQRTSGKIKFRGQEVNWGSPIEAISSGVGMVQQHFCLVDSLPAIDNIILGREPLSGHQIDRRRAIEYLEGALGKDDFRIPWFEITEKLPIETRQKVEILKLIYQKSEVLFLDEPTAVLSPIEIDSFYSFLKRLQSAGKTIVVVTHRISEVMKYCDHYMVLKDGKCVGTGAVGEASENFILSMMIDRKLSDISKSSLSSQRAKLVLKEISNESLKDISLEVFEGEIHGIAGIEGNGQSALVDTILGLEECSGEIYLDGEDISQKKTLERRKKGIAVIPGDRHREAVWLTEDLNTNFLIGNEATFLKNGFIQNDFLAKETRSHAEKMAVKYSNLNQKMSTISGGNQQKFVFARELSKENTSLIICHHPTRGIDLGSINTIHNTLKNLSSKGMPILYISSDLEELAFISHRISVLNRGRLNGQFTGPNFSTKEIGMAMVGENA